MVQIISKIISRADELIKDNFVNNSIYMSFPQYVALVQYSISLFLTQKMYREQPDINPIIFTALCITPFQWFNFRIEPRGTVRINKIRTIDDIKMMCAERHWIDYHDFLIKLNCSNFMIEKTVCKVKKDLNSCTKGVLHRRLFNEQERSYCHKDIIESQFELYRYLLTIKFEPSEKIHFPNETIVEQQLDHFILVNNQNEYLLPAETINNLQLPYKVYPNEHAYLIVDETHKERILQNQQFKCFSVREFFSNLFQKSPYAFLNFKLGEGQYSEIANNIGSEDFIIFGYHRSGNNYEWQFAILSDVAIEKQFVRVSVLHRNFSDRFSHLTNIVNKFLSQ